MVGWGVPSHRVLCEGHVEGASVKCTLTDKDGSLVTIRRTHQSAVDNSDSLCLDAQVFSKIVSEAATSELLCSICFLFSG